jgi:hypothetical protein
MGRADKPFAACAFALVMLAGASGAVAAADPGDPATSEGTNVSASDSGEGPADDTDPSPFSVADNDRTADPQPGDVDPPDIGGPQESKDERGSEKKPADDSGSDHDPDKTINRMPVFIPEAPPVVDLGPIPEELPPPPLEPMPPADLPPLPETPLEPDVVDVTTVGPGAAGPYGNDPPVLSLPAIVAPVPGPPVHVIGASVAPRGAPDGRVGTPTATSTGEHAPSLRRAEMTEPLSLQPPPANAGLAARGQPPNSTGYQSMALRRGRLAEIAAGALPGVFGLVMTTGAGICLGYRQAAAAQRLQPQGADRFLA